MVQSLKPTFFKKNPPFCHKWLKERRLAEVIGINFYLPQILSSFSYGVGRVSNSHTPSPNAVGSHKEICGINVTNKSATTITMNIGNAFLEVLSKDVRPTAQPTNRALPTGGVHSPRAKLKISITPK